MAYFAELSPQQQLHLQNDGSNTTFTLVSTGVGQQQQSASHFLTGPWTEPPQLFQVAQGYIGIVTAHTAKHYLYIQGSQVQVSSEPPTDATLRALNGARSIPVHSAQDNPTEPMTPMTPMAPMTMGSMSMSPLSVSPMTMTMGNMSLSTAPPTPSEPRSAPHPAEQAAGNAAHPAGASPATTAESDPPIKRFCSQCGGAIQVSDRFCAYCGHQLT